MKKILTALLICILSLNFASAITFNFECSKADLKLDWKVDQSDLLIAQQRMEDVRFWMGCKMSQPGCFAKDLNFDWKVNSVDLAIAQRTVGDVQSKLGCVVFDFQPFYPPFY